MFMYLRIVSLPFLLMALASCSSNPAAADSDAAATNPAAKTSARILILTGEDAHHRWQETTPVLESLLEEDPCLEVEVLDDLSRIESTDLSAFDAIIIHFKNDDPKIPGRHAFDQLNSYVRGGGGLILVHFGCGAFQEFRDDFESLVGRVWFGLPAPEGERQHDRYGPFEVRPTDFDHPITDGFTSFATADELYTCLIGNTEVDILAVANSPVDRQDYPMALVRTPDKGRVFLCTLGHDVAAYKAEGVRDLYRRGTAWAAGLPASR
jgi:type 1 glutamine amidotransferase